MNRKCLNRYAWICWIGVLAWTGMAAPAGTVPLTGGPAAAPQAVRVVRAGDVARVALTTMVEAYGFTWRWDMTAQRLSCERGADRVGFVQGVAHYTVNDSVKPLPRAPSRVGSDLYLSVPTVSMVFEPLTGRQLRWVDDGRGLALTTAAYTLLGITCETEQKTTALTLSLADSVSVSVTSFFPKVHIVLEGATIDSVAGVAARPSGIVDSIAAYQLGSSVQIEATVTEPVDTPVVRISSGGKNVVVSLNATGRGGALPDSLLFGDYDDGIATVVIDAGHGGKDPGAIGPSGVLEKDLTLAIALKLRDILKQKTNLKVHLTRDKDEFIPLRERTKVANEKNAHIFVSIHADAIGGSKKRKESVKGYKIYFLSHAKNEADKLVAMRENAVVELEDAPEEADYLQSIITEMVGNEYLRESQDLSIMLVESFAGALKQMRKLHTGIGQANFYVLNGAYMPSVLIEMGFISNSKEEKLLAKKSFQDEFANAVCEAIVDFKQRYGGGQ